jgi:hypothetical protein
MADFLSSIINTIVKPRVVHSLPGKVRIGIPGLQYLQKVQPDAGGIVELLESVFPGVKSISPSFQSGNMLIEYDVALITERKILNGIQSISRTMIKYRGKLANMKPDEGSNLLPKLVDFFRTADADDLYQGKELDIPDNFWP